MRFKHFVIIMLTFIMHSFVKFRFSSDNKTKPLEDTATVKLWKTVA